MTRFLTAVFLLLTLYSASSQADDWALSLGYTVASSEKTSRPSYVSAWMAKPSHVQGGFGGYIGIGFPRETLTGRSSLSSWNKYTLVNGGLVYTLNEHFHLYSGAGLSYQNMKFQGETEHNYRVNLNTGVYVRLGNWGINLGYDTAPRALNLGVTFRSSFLYGYFN